MYTSARQFLAKRRDLMDTIYDVLAKSIIHFENKDHIHEMKLMRVRDECVKYSRILANIDKADVLVNVEDNIQQLLAYIQEERARMKQINMFVDQATSIPAALCYNDVGGGGDMFNKVGGGEGIDGICEKAKRSALKYNNVIVEKSVVLADQHDKENDDDDAIVLYGMICA